MDYKRIYYDIIDKFKNTSGIIKTGEYFETHHIIPKCLGGTNDPTNFCMFNDYSVKLNKIR